MFVLEFCDDPEFGEIRTSEIQYDTCFDGEFDIRLKDLDRFLFLVDMFSIIESCSDDLLSASIEDFDEFWRINKLLLNYVNAIYSYKEYVRSYEPSLKSVTEGYFNQKNWYRFICEFRNYIIHQSVIIKDYSPADRDIFINIEEVSQKLDDYKYSEEWQRQNADKFRKWLLDLKNDSKKIKGNHFLSMKDVALQVKKEISQMKDEVLTLAFDRGVLPTLSWLMDHIYQIDGVYKYTFVLDKANLPESVREPNYAFEDFVRRMVKTLGENDGICDRLFIFAKERGYQYFFDGRCDIEEYVKRVKD